MAVTHTEELFARFEAEGETAVRNSWAGGAYLPDDARLAEEWLRRKDQSRGEAAERAREASSLEQIRIAHSAKNAAWIAATAATIAAIVSIVLMVINLWKR
jgi:hypothetical protein